MAPFAFHGQNSVCVLYNSIILSTVNMSLGTYCFRIGVIFPQNCSEASTSTTKPLPLITCHVILCHYLNQWSQPLEHWNYIPIFNAISYTFSLTAGPSTWILFVCEQQNHLNNASSKSLCLAPWILILCNFWPF